MNKMLQIFLSMTLYELRMNLRGNVWPIGLVMALLVVYSETGTGLTQWPTLNQSLLGFHESVRMIVSIVAFLLAANSVARDLLDTRKQVLYSKPVNIALHMLAKLTGAFSVSIGMALFLMALVILRPWLAGYSAPYNITPFLYMFSLMVLPSLLYICSIGILLTAVTRRVIVSIPFFLGYLFSTLVYTGNNFEPVIYGDFTMRIMANRIGVKLHSILFGPGDLSFAHYFNPLNPELIIRTEIYLSLTVALIGVGALILQKQRG